MSSDHTPGTSADTLPSPRSNVLLRHQEHLRDAVGRSIGDGACVIDADNEIGYVRLQLAPVAPGPDSGEWDGWFNVTRTRSESPLRGKLAKGESVHLVNRAGR